VNGEKMKWNLGEEVSIAGTYQCRNCQNFKEFSNTEQFSECPQCKGGLKVKWILIEEARLRKIHQ